MCYCMKARCTAEASPSETRLSQILQCMIKSRQNPCTLAPCVVCKHRMTSKTAFDWMNL